MAGAHSESVARFGLIAWRWHEASQNRERDESVLAAHAEAAATKTLRQEETLSSAAYVDHISIPGKRTERMVELLSGEVVPVLTVRHPRGMYGWNVPSLVETALTTLATSEVDSTLLREGLTAFLNRVYHDLRNLGQTSRDRALNFAVTNTFQATATFAEAIASQRQLDTIAVEKSPYCRLNNDCWDVVLTFHDPEDGRRSRQVFRFTVDVADSLPVSVGQIKRWAQPGTGAKQV